MYGKLSSQLSLKKHLVGIPYICKSRFLIIVIQWYLLRASIGAGLIVTRLSLSWLTQRKKWSRIWTPWLFGLSCFGCQAAFAIVKGGLSARMKMIWAMSHCSDTMTTLDTCLLSARFLNVNVRLYDKESSRNINALIIYFNERRTVNEIVQSFKSTSQLSSFFLNDWSWLKAGFLKTN